MAKITNGPIGLWLHEQLPSAWQEESKKTQKIVKTLFLRILLQDINNQKFKQGLTELYVDNPAKAKQLSELRPLWANSEFSNRYKLALLRFKKNIYIFKSFGFDPIPTAREFLELEGYGLRKAVRSARKQVIQPLSLRVQEKMVLQVANDLRPRLYSFSRKRQTFIVTSHNLSHDDMVGDLLCRVIENARWYYPFRSYQHMINSCYQAASNHGINRIKWYNAGKRQRLLSDGGTGFFNREVAEEAEFLSGVVHPQVDTLNQVYDGILYNQLLASFKPGIDQDIMSLLVGLENNPLVDRFFNWSTEQLEHPVNSINQLIEKEVHDQYIMDFLNVNSFQITAVRELLHRKLHQYVDLC